MAACGGGGGGGGSTTPPPTTTTYTIGGTASGLSGSVVLQNNGGNDLTVSQNGSFTFSTAVNSGANYSVTVKTQPSGQTCTVSNGSGTATANVTNVSVTCTTSAATNVTIGGSVTGLSGTGLVLQNNGGDNLSISQNGSFTFATAIAPGSQYSVTVATQPSNPTQTCTVTSGSGTASANVTNVTVSCGSTAGTVGKFAFVANNGSANVMSFTIDQTSGALAPQAMQKVGQYPAAVSLSPNGKFAFTATDNGTKIYAFTIDQTTGALIPNANNPFTNTAFTQGHPYPDIAVDPQSKFLYLASYYDGVVAAFSIDGTTGALTQISANGATAGAGAGGIPAFSPDGNYLYVVNQGVGTTYGANVVGTTNNANTVSAFSRDPNTGALTPLGAPVVTGNPNDTAHGAEPSWIVFTPNGKFAYVSNTGQASVSVFSVTNGALTLLNTVAATGNPNDLTIDASGTHLYVPNSTSSGGTPTNGNVAVFSINQSTGNLTQVGTSVTAGKQPIFLQIEATGHYAYVSSNGGQEIYGYSIDQTTGGLTALSTPWFKAGTNPNFVNIDPSGKFLYAANRNGGGAGTISAFTIDPNTGLLTPIAGTDGISTGGNSPFFVSISPEAPGIRD